MDEWRNFLPSYVNFMFIYYWTKLTQLLIHIYYTYVHDVLTVLLDIVCSPPTSTSIFFLTLGKWPCNAKSLHFSQYDLEYSTTVTIQTDDDEDDVMKILLLLYKPFLHAYIKFWKTCLAEVRNCLLKSTQLNLLCVHRLRKQHFYCKYAYIHRYMYIGCLSCLFS